MKKLVFVKNLDDEVAKEKISKALDQTRAIYSISTASKCVVIEGNNDIVRAAITAIKELGYIVE